MDPHRTHRTYDRHVIALCRETLERSRELLRDTERLVARAPSDKERAKPR